MNNPEQFLKVGKKYNVFNIFVNYADENESPLFDHGGFTCFHEIPLRIGLHFPIPSLMLKFLTHLDLILAQRMPNFLRVLLKLFNVKKKN